MDISDIMRWRRDRLAALRREVGAAKLSDVTGIADAYLYQMSLGKGKNYRPLDDENARLIEAKTNREGWFSMPNQVSALSELPDGSPSEPALPDTLSAMGRKSLQRIIDATARAEGRLDEFLQKIAEGLEQAADRAPDGRVRALKPGHLYLVRTVSMIAGALPEKQAKAFGDLIWSSVPPESDMSELPVMDETTESRGKRPRKTHGLQSNRASTRKSKAIKRETS